MPIGTSNLPRGAQQYEFFFPKEIKRNFNGTFLKSIIINSLFTIFTYSHLQEKRRLEQQSKIMLICLKFGMPLLRNLDLNPMGNCWSQFVLSGCKVEIWRRSLKRLFAPQSTVRNLKPLEFRLCGHQQFFQTSTVHEF